MPESEVGAIIQRYGMRSLTPNTITTPAALRAELETILFAIKREALPTDR